MALHQEDNKYYLKLICSFLQEIYPLERVVESILERKGDINYKIPLNSYVTEPNLVGCTVLHIAAMENETTTVDILLKNGADLTVQDEEGRTALHCAVDQEIPNKELVDIILSKHLSSAVTSNPCDANGLSHFHIACLYNHTDAVKFFLNSSASVDMSVNSDAKRFAGYTPLHFAAEGAAVSAIRILLEHNAKMNVKDARGLTPLHLLLEKKIKLLDSYNTSNERVQNDGTITMIEDAMDLLLDIDDVDDIGLTQFHIACTQRDVSLVEYYLEQNVDVNKALNMDSPLYPGYTALHFAAHCNINIVRKLLKIDANFEAKDANGVTPMDLFWKIYKGEDLSCILEQKWKYLTFSDGETRLLDFLKFTGELEVLGQYLENVQDVRMTMNTWGPGCWKGRTLLHFAVMLRENSELVKLCMRRGVHSLNPLVNAQDSLGLSPIHLAFRLDKLDVVEILMNSCINIENVTDSENLSHLHIACALNNYDKAVEVCPEYKFDLAYRGRKTYGNVTPGSTALNIAVANGNSQIVDMLIKKGLKVESRDDNGQTPLDLFLRLNGYEAVSISRIILSSGPVTNDMIERMGLTRLHMLIYCQDVDISKFINERNIKAVIKCHDSSSFLHKYDGCTALHMAMMRGARIDAIKSLIEQGADLLVKNQHGDTPLYSALTRKSDWKGMNLIVETLLHKRSLRRQFEEMSGITMLHIACYTVDLHAVSWILTGSVDVNARVRSDCSIWAGCTPLYVLLKTFEYHGVTDDIDKMLGILLEAGADVTIMDSNNETPIHHVLQNCPIDRTYSVLKRLIEILQTYDSNPIGRNGMSHFHAACLVNNVEAVKSFLENDVDVNQPVDFFAKDFAGMTPLHLAVHYETRIEWKRETIRLLLTNGADIKAEDNLGQTPLHEATKLTYSLDILEILIGSGAAVDARDIFERTPLELLLRSEYVTLEKIKLFEKYGCRLNVSNPLTEEGYISQLISLRYHPNCMKVARAVVVGTQATEVISQCFDAMVDDTDVFIPDDMGRNLIHNIVTTNNPHCEIFNYDDLIKIYQSVGVDIDLQDKKGKTALHLAAQFGNLPAVNALLNSGADVNILDATNMTPLNYAMRYYNNKMYCSNKCHRSIIKCLVLYVRKLQHLNLVVNPNNIWEREEPWSFIGNEKRNLILSTVQFDDPINYQNQIEKVWSWRVTDQPRLILGDFLSETGKGLTLYSVMPDLRNRVDEFFRTYSNGLKDVCSLQYRKTVKRVSLVELAVDSVLAIAGSNVPIEVVEIIIRYLPNVDLVNLIKGTNAVTRKIATVDTSS